MPNNPTWDETQEVAPSWDDTVEEGQPIGEILSRPEPFVPLPFDSGGREQLFSMVGAVPPKEESISKLLGGVLSEPLDAAGKGVVEVLNLPTTLHNKLGGYEPGMYAYAEPRFVHGEQLSPVFKPITEEESVSNPRLAGTYNAVANAANQLTTPENLFTLPFAASRSVLGYFLANTLANEPAAIESAVETVRDPQSSTMQSAESVANAALVQPAMAALMGLGLKRPVAEPSITPDIEAAAAQGAPPIRQLGLQVPQSPFFNPGVREIAGRALEEAGNRSLMLPGQEPALLQLRREFQPQIEPVTGRPKADPLGGQISFDAPAEARAVPSARQSAPPVSPETQLGTNPSQVYAIYNQGSQVLRSLQQKPIESAGEVPAPKDSGPVDAGGGQGDAAKATEKLILPEDTRQIPGFSRPTVTDVWAQKILPKLNDISTWKQLIDQVKEGEVALTNSADTLGFAIRSEGQAALPKLRQAMKARRELLDQWRDKLENGSPLEQAEAFKQFYASQFFSEVIEAATRNDKTNFAYKDAPGKPIEIPLGESTFDDIQSIKKYRDDQLKTQPDIPLEVEGVTSLDPASGIELSATDSLINKLEGLKFAEATEGRLYSLPHPDAIKQIGKTAWNNGIDVAIAAVKAGRAVGDAINEAISYIKKNASGFDEAQARANMEAALREENISKGAVASGVGDSVQSKPKPSGANPPSALEGENVKMRKLSARGTQAESIPTPVREKIAQAPESFYQQQSMRKVVDTVKGFTDADLTAITEDSPIYTAAKLEQANRLFDSGKNEAGYKIFQDLSENLTRLGQVINQAKLLQGLNPENVVKVTNEGLKKAGRDPLTTKQAGELTDRSKRRIESERALDKATDEWVKNPSDANAKAAETALNKSNEAALHEQEMVHRFQHRPTTALLKAILQGNLLTPISQVANIVGNMSFGPFRSATRTGAAALDVITSALRGTPREATVRPVTGTVQTAKGLLEGLKQIPDIILKGSGNVIKGEQRAGLHPLEAWTKMFAKNPEMPTVGGKVPFRDRVNLAIEGTFGMPAESMLRLLGAGDAPFRSAARARLIAEAAKLKGVPDSRLDMARKFPELFFDKETLGRIEAETAETLFQRQSTTLQHLTSLLGKKGGLFDLAVSTVAPYKVTPWNIIKEILSYNPLIAAGNTVRQASKGNRRSAEMSAAKMVVGGTLAAAGWWLYKNGLMAPSLDSRDEAQKARILSGQVIPPNHINVSGLKRAIDGGDPTFKPGDETVDVFRAGGLAGSMFYMAANIGRDFERKPESTSSLAMDLMKDSILEQARFGVNQSFLKGVSGVLQSVTTGETDNFVQGLLNSIISIPLPNTLSAMSRVDRKYKVVIKDDNLLKEFGNIVKNRLGVAELDQFLPLKRGLWGEPLLETPKDRNALLYHFFDISKNQQVTDDAVTLELYRLWRKTADTTVIPSLPGKEITVNRTTYPLTPDQQSRYAELVGENRRNIVDKLVVNPNWSQLTDEMQIKLLNMAYERGMDMGKAFFYMETEGELEAKPTRRGFESNYTAPIDTNRAKLNNADGSFSTERTITIGADGKYFVIPTIVGGKQLSEQEAINQWKQGKNKEVGRFGNEDQANRYAEQRSKQIGVLRQ